MSRYMRTDLRNDLLAINLTALEQKRDTYLRAEGRNGYTGLDEHRRSDDGCIRNIQCGTPKECLAAAHQWEN